MKKIVFNILILLSVAFTWSGCKDHQYAEAEISPYIPLFDLRTIYKGSEVTLDVEKMFGSSSVTGVVVSDHSGKNLPEGLLIIQEKRRLSKLRGISIAIGAEAANYVPGDSVAVNVVGGVLKRINGVLQITGIPGSAVTKIAAGLKIPPYRVASSLIKAKPDDYESVLVAIVKAGFQPGAGPADVYGGDKSLNDGFGNITLHTEASATFANTSGLNFNANYYGIILNKEEADGSLTPLHRMRTLADVRPLSAVPEVTPIVITGFMSDVKGGDGNHDYMQFMATRDINFALTPFAVVTTNNAGASVPTGLPSLGWATGSLAKTGNARTYKFNLTSGTVQKGEFFYVGGSTKLINGPNSTSIADSKWIRSFDYSTTNGDGFGLKSTNILANTGNATGFAVFEGTNVTADTAPVDVVFVGGGGSLYSGNIGYRIANNDYYDKVNVLSDDLKPQPFYTMGTNTMNFAYLTADQGYFNKLGGIYNVSLGKWVKARTQSAVLLTKTSVLNEIEGVFPEATPEIPEGVPSTKLED